MCWKGLTELIDSNSWLCTGSLKSQSKEGTGEKLLLALPALLLLNTRSLKISVLCKSTLKNSLTENIFSYHGAEMSLKKMHVQPHTSWPGQGVEGSVPQSHPCCQPVCDTRLECDSWLTNHHWGETEQNWCHRMITVRQSKSTTFSLAW